MASIKLSILICSLTERAEKLNTLIDNLYEQYKGLPQGSVEILTEIDNREMKVGAKKWQILPGQLNRKIHW